MQYYNDEYLNGGNTFTNWLRQIFTGQCKGYAISVVILIIIIIILIIVIPISCKKQNYRRPRTEKYAMELASGGNISEDIYTVNGKPVTNWTIDGKQYNQKLEARGYNTDDKPSNLLNGPNPVYEFQNYTNEKQAGSPSNNGGIAQLAQKIKTNTVESKTTAEKYIGMKQSTRAQDYYNDNYENQQGTLNDLNVLKNQVENVMILKSPNIDNNTAINDINIMKQLTSAKQKQLNDVNEIEQEQRNNQVAMDFDHMRGQAYGRNIQMSGASTMQQQDTNIAVKYHTNSNIPNRINVPLTQETMQSQIAYTSDLSTGKEMTVKAQGLPTIKVEVPKAVKSEMATTKITQEPVINTDSNQVILNQQTQVDPTTGEQKLVETAIDLDTVGKTETFVREFPASKITDSQRAALNYFYTVLFVYKAGGVEIPDLKSLLDLYPDLYKVYNLKSDTYANLQRMEKKYGNFMQKKIAYMNNADAETLDTTISYIIKSFFEKYNKNPLQKYVAGTISKTANGDTKVEKDFTTLAAENASIKDFDETNAVPTAETYTRRVNRANYKTHREHYSYVIKNNKVYRK